MQRDPVPLKSALTNLKTSVAAIARNNQVPHLQMLGLTNALDQLSAALLRLEDKVEKIGK